MANVEDIGQVVAMTGHEMALFESMLSAIPEVSEDSYADILMQIAGAESAEDLDKAFDGDSLRDFIGCHILVNSLKRAESDFTGGLGQFLIINFTRLDTGESLVATTGAVSIVAQLAVAFNKNMLPLRCMVIQKDKPTKNGFYPMHLKTSGFEK